MYRTTLVKRAVGFIEKRRFSCHEFTNFLFFLLLIHGFVAYITNFPPVLANLFHQSNF